MEAFFKDGVLEQYEASQLRLVRYLVKWLDRIYYEVEYGRYGFEVTSWDNDDIFLRCFEL